MHDTDTASQIASLFFISSGILEIKYKRNLGEGRESEERSRKRPISGLDMFSR
jgi:hypothetical protein